MKATGRSEKVYGRRCPPERLEHEVWITELELLVGTPLQRNARAGETFSDGSFVREGIRYFVEVDMGSMTMKQMRKKFERYEGVKAFILVICHKNTLAAADANRRVGGKCAKPRPFHPLPLAAKHEGA